MKHLTKIFLLMVLMALATGCASEKKSEDAPAAADDTPPVVDVPDGPFVPDGNGPGEGPGDDWQFGGTAELDVVSLNRMSEYTGRPMNNPQDIRVNLNLEKIGDRYGGTVTISYVDNGVYEEGYFTSGHSSKEVKYNLWTHFNGTYGYHGFFEDFLGGLIVVIDEIVDLGDGGATDKINGAIYFKNFGLTYAPHPPTRCWFVSLGPYDCRSWKSGESVDTTASLYPNAGYQKLGDFEGMSISEAFNGDVEDILANQ